MEKETNRTDTNKTEISKTQHPYLYSILCAILCTFMTGLGMEVAALAKIDTDNQLLVMAAFVALSVCISLLIIKFNENLSFVTCGFRKPEKDSIKKVWYFLPLLIVEVMPLFAGFEKGITVKQYLILLLFVVAVGFNEEIYFRGLTLHFLSAKGAKTAIIVSSIIFGLMHLANALGGKEPLYLILQVILAFCVGFVFSELFFLTKSIWFLIFCHALHDYLASVTGNMFNGQLVLLALQVLTIVIYAVILWKKLGQTETCMKKE